MGVHLPLSQKHADKEKTLGLGNILTELSLIRVRDLIQRRTTFEGEISRWETELPILPKPTGSLIAED